MSAERLTTGGPRLEPVIAELRQRVAVRYPDARFEVFEGEDPRGTYLRAVIDVEDTHEVVDLVIDRLLDLQVEDRLPLYFVASRPPERLSNHHARESRPGPGLADERPSPEADRVGSAGPVFGRFESVNCSGPPSVGLDALLRARFHGAVNIRGIRYQLLYSALLTLRLHDEGGEQISVRFEGVEDVDLLGLEAGGEYVQVKTAVTRWNWALRRGAGARRGGFRGTSPGASRLRKNPGLSGSQVGVGNG